MKLKDSLRKKIIASVMTGVMAVVVAAPYSMVSAADMTHGRLPVKAVQKDGLSMITTCGSRETGKTCVRTFRRMSKKTARPIKKT